MNFKHIYKIIDKTELQEAKDKGSYSGSLKDKQDGFIHFSSEEQIKGTLEKFYLNQNNLILLKVKTINLNHLIWEQASDGNMFPHLYSSLDLSSVVDEFEISLDKDNIHKIPNIF